MKSIQYIVIASVLCTSSVVLASSDHCTIGKTVYLSGEINNNAVAINTPTGLPMTLGVAELKLTGKKSREKLVCTLLGNPNSDKDSATGKNEHDFDHMLVCDEHSQLSLDTRFVGAEPINPWLEKKICQGRTVSYFQEISLPDVDPYDDHAQFDPAMSEFYSNKGKFKNVKGGSISVTGCVNFGNDANQLQINMVLRGYLCL